MEEKKKREKGTYNEIKNIINLRSISYVFRGFLKASEFLPFKKFKGKDSKVQR